MSNFKLEYDNVTKKYIMSGNVEGDLHISDEPLNIDEALVTLLRHSLSLEEKFPDIVALRSSSV